MLLTIDGQKITANPGETLLELIKKLDMDTESLKTRPVAAKIGGEIFSLNYVPNRKPGDISYAVTYSMRWAMRTGGGVVNLIRMTEDTGRDIYERTLQFIFLYACRKLFPDAETFVQFSIGQGIYITIDKETPLTNDDVRVLKEECLRVIHADLPLVRERMDIFDAMDYFADVGNIDKLNLLRWRTQAYFDVYSIDDYKDYFYSEMLPSTGYVTVFDVKRYHGGVLLMRPDRYDPDTITPCHVAPNLFETLCESNRWDSLMNCLSVSDLNDAVQNGTIRELARVNEALHERSFALTANEIVNRNAKIVLIAGPSSSGKTTSANRLCTQLRVQGKSPIMISLDDYYMDRDKIPLQEDGSIDLEHINTIDIEQFNQDIRRLLAGEVVELPSFDFVTSKRVWRNRLVSLDENTVLVIEGLHALNPTLLDSDIDNAFVFKIYVSALITLNLDAHNRIPTTNLRLLRRIVRDCATRGSTVEHTLSMWDSVRQGEERWIFPYQQNADAVFNSSLVYELVVLKRQVYPLLLAVHPESPCFSEVRQLVKFLNYIREANIDDEIPPTSILREFVGGNVFYR